MLDMHPLEDLWFLSHLRAAQLVSWTPSSALMPELCVFAIYNKLGRSQKFNHPNNGSPKYLFIWQLFTFCKFLPFFYFLTFEKADCSIFTLLVGWSVGRLVDVTINFFNIYRHKSPLLTQYNSIPISTKLYWPSTNKLQPVSPHTDPVTSNTNQYCPVQTQYSHISWWPL